ncbi:sulfite exporter TauE/SafE family protein [Mangrovicoccus sp. HB161399]|uniref:sulfite exporter TauE/SafE family protein n=1 Tax=Mangrovicoccus sp. HB161399 TaxID=2720392 RepID=UPI001551CAEF|nr:sulfite exporter TauE/SafE family protein [Mangrovicoccus sp. HB161399]
MTLEMILLVIAAFVVGLSKGGLAAAGALAVPMLTIWMDPLTAAASLLPVYIASDIIAVAIYRKQPSWANLRILVPASMAGVALAALVAPHVPVAAVTLLTGTIGLAYVAQSVLMPPPDVPHRARLGRGLFWGLLTGVTSFISHNGAPPFTAYVLPQKLPNLAFAGTATIVFAVVNLCKLPAYHEIGLTGGLSLRMLVPLIGVAIAGAFAGRWIVGRLPQKVYSAVIRSLLGVVSAYLCVIAAIELA